MQFEFAYLPVILGTNTMPSDNNYVCTDEHGVMRVASTKVMLDSIVAAFCLGHSAETIQQQYPALTLGEVYGAIAYYLANQDEVDNYLKRQNELWEERAERPISDQIQPCNSCGARRLRSRRAGHESPKVFGRSRLE